jgi:hypothetical protein
MLVIAEQFDARRLMPTQFEAAKAAAIANHRSGMLQRRNRAVIAESAEIQAITASSRKAVTCNQVAGTILCY